MIEFRLEKPPGFSFLAGQFVLFLVPLHTKSEDIQPRAFSIASAPEESDLLFIAKLKEGGRASTWIAEDLRPGSVVTFQAPFGAFTLDERSERPPLFIGTCSGVAPFRSTIVHLLRSGYEKPMDLIFGVRSEENVFWQEEFAALTKSHPKLKVHLALSQPSPAWKGLKGRVQTVAEQVIFDLADRAVFVCGNPDMVRELKELSLTKWGIPKEHVHTEGYV